MCGGGVMTRGRLLEGATDSCCYRENVVGAQSERF